MLGICTSRSVLINAGRQKQIAVEDGRIGVLQWRRILPEKDQLARIGQISDTQL